MVNKITQKILAKNPKIHPDFIKLGHYFQQTQLNDVANDLIRKKYLDPRFAVQLALDAQVRGASIFNYIREPFSTHSCPDCMIVIRGPKEWMKHHIKTHFRPDSKKENEMQIAKTQIYR